MILITFETVTGHEMQPEFCTDGHGVPSPLASELVTHNSSPETKIVLFRSLFRGREDVYPRRFESRKTGRAGYQPACANEWERGLCDKPRTKCSDCVNRRLLPVTDEVVRWHLSGQDDRGHDFVMGVYPLLPDETCCFLAVDFDRDTWQTDATAFLQSGQGIGLPAALERSRSGNGGQEHGYFVLRFLGEDVGKHLDTVLDTILRALAHRPINSPSS